MHRLGEFELHALSDGFFRLDGGAMFGIVPRTAWEKVATPDDRNRLRLALTTLLIRTGKANVLVDTGIGDRRDARFAELYALERPPALAGSLREIGLGPGDIDVVILSHLHLDHAGGATVRRGGEVVPAFPKAVYVVQEGMLEEALRPNPRTKGSYDAEDFLPLREAGRLRLARGDEEIVPGVSVILSGGHVERHQMVVAESGGRKAVYWGDVLPTTAHVRPAWVTGYDLFPAELAAFKERMEERAAAEEWVSVFEHDPSVAMGILRKEEKGYCVEAVERVAGSR